MLVKLFHKEPCAVKDHLLRVNVCPSDRVEGSRERDQVSGLVPGGFSAISVLCPVIIEAEGFLRMDLQAQEHREPVGIDLGGGEGKTAVCGGVGTVCRCGRILRGRSLFPGRGFSSGLTLSGSFQGGRRLRRGQYLSPVRIITCIGKVILQAGEEAADKGKFSGKRRIADTKYHGGREGGSHRGAADQEFSSGLPPFFFFNLVQGGFYGFVQFRGNRDFVKFKWHRDNPPSGNV